MELIKIFFNLSRLMLPIGILLAILSIYLDEYMMSIWNLMMILLNLYIFRTLKNYCANDQR